jgi:hypothetical protein
VIDPGGVLVRRRIVEDSLPGPSCLTELCRTIEDLAEGVAEDWWQFFGLVAARRFVPP